MKAFSRSIAIFAAMSAIMHNDSISHSERQLKALETSLGYYSRGKGGRKSPRTATGVARAKRTARKLHNVRIRSAH